jgi:hypothetical protein
MQSNYHPLSQPVRLIDAGGVAPRPRRITASLAAVIGLFLCLLCTPSLRADDQGTGNPLGEIRNVRDTLVGLRDSAATPAEAGLMDQAIKRLGRAIDPALWLDNSHLQPKTGAKVFGELANAVSRLLALMNQADASVSAQDLTSMIDNLLRASGSLAATALREAVDGGGDPIAIADAAALFQQATDKIGAGDIQGAIQLNGAAWARATAALP